MDDRNDDTPQPLDLRPSNEPWKPSHGRMTRIVAWAILIIMLLGSIAAFLITLATP